MSDQHVGSGHTGFTQQISQFPDNLPARAQFRRARRLLDALWQYPGAAAQSRPVVDENAREGCDLSGNIAPGIHRLAEGTVHYYRRGGCPLILVMETVGANWGSSVDDWRFDGIYFLFVGLTPGARRNKNHQDQWRHRHLQCFQISSCRGGRTTILACVR